MIRITISIIEIIHLSNLLFYGIGILNTDTRKGRYSPAANSLRLRLVAIIALMSTVWTNYSGVLGG